MRTKYLFAVLMFVPLLAGLSAQADWQEEFAAAVHEAREAGLPMPQLSVRRPEATLDDAYAVQRHLVKLLLKDEAPTTFKAAIIAEAGQRAMGLAKPLVAVLPPKGVLPAVPPAVVDLKADPARHLETEIGYLIGKDITEPLKDAETLRTHLAAVAAIIEVPGGAVELTQPATAPDLLAWNINAKELILGAPMRVEAIPVDEIEITLTHNDTVVNTGKGNQAAGGQWTTLLHTINELVRLGYRLEAGAIITNGALGKVVKAEPGSYHADFGILGSIDFTVVDAAPPAEPAP